MTLRLRSADGTMLVADLDVPPGASRGVVLIHGGGVDRHEGGFFDRLADSLGQSGIASLRLDLRGHGESDGVGENLTLAGVGNDIRAAIETLAMQKSIERVSLLGASFSGGVCASVAARYPKLIDRLILINPLFDYKDRFIDQKDYWHGNYIDRSAADALRVDGYVEHSPTFRLGGALLNEVFWWDSRGDLALIGAPVLIVHGTGDTFISVDSSREAMRVLNASSKLLELDGAQHGLAVHDDPSYGDPQTQRWQSETIAKITQWLTG